MSKFNDALGACMQRLMAGINRHLTRGDRHFGFRAVRGEDGYDYVQPIPSGAVPMARRRMRNVKG